MEYRYVYTLFCKYFHVHQNPTPRMGYTVLSPSKYNTMHGLYSTESIKMQHNQLLEFDGFGVVRVNATYIQALCMIWVKSIQLETVDLWFRKLKVGNYLITKIQNNYMQINSIQCSYEELSLFSWIRWCIERTHVSYLMYTLIQRMKSNSW